MMTCSRTAPTAVIMILSLDVPIQAHTPTEGADAHPDQRSSGTAGLMGRLVTVTSSCCWDTVANCHESSTECQLFHDVVARLRVVSHTQVTCLTASQSNLQAPYHACLAHPSVLERDDAVLGVCQLLKSPLQPGQGRCLIVCSQGHCGCPLAVAHNASAQHG